MDKNKTHLCTWGLASALKIPFSILENGYEPNLKAKGIFIVSQVKADSSSAHTRWNCKYQIVFIAKYRRKIIYGKLRQDIGKILRQLCEFKVVEILEAYAMLEYIHMLVKMPPKMSASIFIG